MKVNEKVKSLTSVCYLMSDYSNQKIFLHDGVIICPESTLNGNQIKDWVLNLKVNPKEFFTCSLFLIRELELQKINVLWINFNENGKFENLSIDCIGNIEILDRELEQSDRYVNHENRN